MSEVTAYPSKAALKEAFELSLEILRNLEMSEIPLENIALKTGRLARLLNDSVMQNVIEYEISGYPTTPNGVSLAVYQLAVIAGREYETEDISKQQIQGKKSTIKQIYNNSIKQLEESLKFFDSAILAAKDPNISVSSSNPSQFVWAPAGNHLERGNIKNEYKQTVARLSSRRSFIYHYVLKKNFELKFSGVADDIFTRIRARVDYFIGNILGESVKKFSAVYDNLQSDNSEDWSNAVHSCRRILENLADVVFPPQDEPKIKAGKIIKLGKNNYINRIIAFIENSSSSKRYEHLVGSHLEFLGDRLDSIFQAAQKGSHDNILTREEADRYVVYTYMLIGDVLSLWNEKQLSVNDKQTLTETIE